MKLLTVVIFIPFVILFAFKIYQYGAEVSTDKTEFSRAQNVPSFSSHRATGDGRDLGGVTQRPGLSIHWAGSGAGAFEDSVRPIDVIEATIERLQHEQTTDLGSNANAMALVEMLKARDAINGTTETMEDGTPVIK